METEKTGSFIAELRKEKGLTQLQLAELLHVSDKAVSRWETGRGFPDIGSLEDLADALDVSVAELLKGERLHEEVTREDIQEVASAGTTIFRQIMEKTRIQNLLVGFLAGLAIIALLVIHLNSPIAIKGSTNALELQELGDGKVIAILKKGVAGCDMDGFVSGDDGQQYVFISCYRTLWNDMFGNDSEQAVVLPDAGTVYYYPGNDTNGDELLLARGTDSSGGVETQPRLIYRFWLLLGSAVSIIALAYYHFFGKKKNGKSVLRYVLMPVALTIAMIIILAGHLSEMYNAAYYFSGIILMAVVIYILLIYAVNRKAVKK